MKFLIILILFGLSIEMAAQSNSNVFEIVPSFEQRNLEYISEIIDFELTADMAFVGISCFYFGTTYKDITFRYKDQGKWSQWQIFLPQHELVESNRKAYEGEFITSQFSALQFKTTEVLESKLIVRLFAGMKSNSTRVSVQKSFLCGPVDA